MNLDKELNNWKKDQIDKALYEAQTVSPLVWAYYNKAISERGSPISFKDHKYLIQPWSSLSNKQVYMKSAQMGVSVMMIFKTMWLAKFRKMNIIYTLPTVEDVRVFVPSKVNPIIQNNHKMAVWVKDKDAVETKKVSGSFIFYRGTFTQKEAIMLSSDLNAYDEVDRSDLETIDIYSSRLKYSDFKGEWFFSNPSAPSVGVGAKFAASNQFHWFVKPSCGHWQYMDWEKNVDRKYRRYMCQYCYKVITDEERKNGKWIAKYPSREFQGYWINQMMASWVKCEELIAEEEEKDKAYFYNFVLGKPYMGTDIVIDASLILTNVTQKFNDKTKAIMGVDQGLKKHYVVGNAQGIFEVGTTKDWKDIENIRNKYDAIAIMDALPDLTVPRQMREKYHHKVYLCYYHRDKDKAVEVKWGKDKDWGFVWADRNRSLQTVIDYLSGRKIEFTMDGRDLDEYITHWKNMYKLVVEDSLGVPKFVWEANGPDHFCLIEGTLIETLKGKIPIEKIKVGNMVLTREGYKRVYRSWLTRKNAKVIKVIFSNGKELIGTPDHKIWIIGKGFVALHSTNYGDSILLCNNQKRLFFKALLRSGIENTLIRVLFFLCQKSLIVLSVIKNLKQFLVQAVNSVQQDVTIVSTQEFGEKDTYNLSVENSHEYYANDILVSNCHATNYFLIGLKRFSEQHGAVLKDKSQFFHGTPSFEVKNNTMPGKSIFEKEPKDWRYV